MRSSALPTVDVRLVYEIALEEISICRRGAVPGTWCSLTDMNGAKSMLQGRGLEAEGAAVKVRQAIEDLNKLSAVLA